MVRYGIFAVAGKGERCFSSFSSQCRGGPLLSKTVKVTNFPFLHTGHMPCRIGSLAALGTISPTWAFMAGNMVFFLALLKIP
jgi:hypothetical protein